MASARGNPSLPNPMKPIFTPTPYHFESCITCSKSAPDAIENRMEIESCGGGVILISRDEAQFDHKANPCQTLASGPDNSRAGTHRLLQGFFWSKLLHRRRSGDP